jgi:hypothetical protein
VSGAGRSNGAAPFLSCRYGSRCANIPQMAKPIQKNLRVPRDMAPLITAEAQKQGVSENAWMLAVIAAVVGYKLPEK